MSFKELILVFGDRKFVFLLQKLVVFAFTITEIKVPRKFGEVL